MKLSVIIFAALIASFGVGCCFFSRAVQVLAERALDIAAIPEAARLRTYVRSGAYLWHLRSVGVVCIVMGVLLLYAVSKAR